MCDPSYADVPSLWNVDPNPITDRLPHACTLTSGVRLEVLERRLFYVLIDGRSSVVATDAVSRRGSQPSCCQPTSARRHLARSRSS